MVCTHLHSLFSLSFTALVMPFHSSDNHCVDQARLYCCTNWVHHWLSQHLNNAMSLTVHHWISQPLNQCVMPSSNGNRRCRRLVLSDFFLVILCVWLCLIFFQLCLISSWWFFVSSYAFMVVLCFQLCPKITYILTVTVSCTHPVSLYMLRISWP